MTIDSYLQDYKILIFAGNGGTGKTTLSAAWAMEAAERGKNVGLITIDPSRRLGEAFGMDVLKETHKRKAVGDRFVDVFLIDSEKTIKEFVLKNFDKDFHDQLLKNKLFSQVATILSENQSVSTIYKLAEMIDSKQYDLIVVDTPPSNHALDFFRSPEHVFRIFKENIIAKAVLEAKGLKFWSSKKIFVRVLSYLAGEEFVQEMESFFLALFSFQEHIVHSAQKLEKCLKSRDVSYFLVSLPEEDKIQEVLDLAHELRDQSIQVRNLVINRSHPEWLSIEQKLDGFSQGAANFQMYYEKLWVYYREQRQKLEELMKAMKSDMTVYQVPEMSAMREGFSLPAVQQILRQVFQ
jgi:anion-transporting  ArsA/GET3 family ATPase